MPVIYGNVNVPSNTSAADGSNSPALQGKQGELLDANLHGKYYTQAYRGLSFNGQTLVAGVVVPIYNTTTQVFGIWNRAGNTRNAALQTFDAGVAAVGTGVVSNMGFSQTANAGGSLATGQISAFTPATPIAGSIGVSGGNTVSFTQTAATTIASTWLMTLNYSYFSTAFLTSPQVGAHYDFDEGVIVPPNWAIWAGCSTAANGSTMNLGLRWSEPPV